MWIMGEEGGGTKRLLVFFLSLGILCLGINSQMDYFIAKMDLGNTINYKISL